MNTNEMAARQGPVDARKSWATDEQLNAKIRDKVAKATVTVLEKGGRGILVPGGLIVTAAHCVECVCDGSMRTGIADWRPVKIGTSIGELSVTVHAIEPCSDIAVLGPLDGQEFLEEWEGFERFCDETTPVNISQRDFEIHEGMPVHIYGLNDKWMCGDAKQWSPYPLWTCMETNEMIQGGSSGGPIVNEAGELVGVVSLGVVSPGQEARFSSSFARPHLALPVWICRQIFDRRDS